MSGFALFLFLDIVHESTHGNPGSSSLPVDALEFVK